MIQQTRTTKEEVRKVNLLIFEPYPFNSEGGNQKTLRYLLTFINKEKIKPIVLVPLKTKFSDRLSQMGFECLELSPSKRINRYGGACVRDGMMGRLWTLFDLLIYNIRLLLLLKRNKIDVVYSNCIRAVLSTGIATKLARIPNLLYVKGELQNERFDRIGFYLADKILFFCEANKHDNYPDLVQKFNSKIGILRIGINMSEVQSIQNKNKDRLIKELSLSDKNINCIVLSQLYPPKGIHYLLEAIGQVIRDFPNLKLFILGDHCIEEYRDYKKQLDDIVNKQQIEKNVSFAGWRQDAWEVLACMDILIHPSFREGFGRAVLEAMAFGKPVIASRVGGLREIIQDGENGLFIEPGNKEQLTEKLSLLLNDGELRKRLGRKAQDTVVAEYLIEDKVLQFEQIVLELAQPGH